MSRSRALLGARALGLGRVAIGAMLLVAPARAGRPWLGDVADAPGGVVALRALGIRDLILGAIALHTADHPQVGPRWQRTLAIADGVDFAATLAARSSLPARGSALVLAMAAAGSIGSVVLGHALGR